MPQINEFNKKLMGKLKSKSKKDISFIETPETTYTQIPENKSSSKLDLNDTFLVFTKNDNRMNQTEITQTYKRNNFKQTNEIIINKKQNAIENENEKLIKEEIKKEIIKIDNLKEINKTFDEIEKEKDIKISKNLKIKVNNQIKNPPMIFSSFLESNDNIHFDKNLFETLIKKSENFNLETQRRGRRRSRFPDPQWDCAETQIAKLVRYLCEEEISSSYQKYCKPIFEQINTMIESFLYHDNNLEICQNLHMCPVSVDF